MSLPRPNSIFGRIFLTALLPIVFLAVLLSAYAINARLDDLQGAHTERGNAKAQQLASSAVLGLFTGDASMLQAACDRLLASSDDIRRVVVSDRSHAIVAESARPGAPDESSSHNMFVAPVVAPVIELDEHEKAGEEPPLGEVSVYFSDRAIVLARQRVLGNALLITLLSVALAVLLTAIVARQIVRPIDALREAVGRMHQGDLNARIGELSHGELGELQSGFNGMAEQIAASANNLRQQVDEATASLRDALGELEHKNADLELARRREHAANRAKSVFLANMSHEIRTPMNGVLGFASLLRKSELDATQREFLDTIIRSANNLLAIINDILDFSEMEAGRLRLENVGFDLREAIEDVTCLLSPQAHEKKLELISWAESSVPARLVGDVTRLRHILTNLIGNAVKFTEAGEVIVHARGDGGSNGRFMLELSVSDTGVGISDEVLDALFQPFYQGPVSTRRLYGGTGLGLSISHSLVEAMNGTISVDSKVGEGTRFTVRLPFDIDRRHADTTPHAEALLRATVAVVDQHPLSRRAFSQLLEEAGYSVLLRNSVAAAAQEPPPALWLLRCPVKLERTEILGLLAELRRSSNAPVCLLLPTMEPAFRREIESHEGCHVHGYPTRSRKLLKMLAEIVAARTAVRDEHPRGRRVNDRWLDGRTVLVADDNQINLRLADTLLRSYGAETLLAHDGNDVLSLAETHAVDLFLVDIHMPGCSGLDVAHDLRKQSRYTHTPIIALTADVIAQRGQGKEPGPFDAWLLKPLREDILIELLDRKLGYPDAPGGPVAGADASSMSDAPLVRDREQAIGIAGGNAELADELFDELLARLPGHLSAIQVQYGERDWNAMWQLVHKLKGGAAACGVPALHLALQRLESAIADSETDQMALRLSSLQSEADRLAAETTRTVRGTRLGESSDRS